MSEYLAGSCNIGPQEIRRRKAVAYLGLFLTIVSLIGFIKTGASASARIGIFFPALVFSIGYIQSRKKFCLAYGFLGTFNLGKLGDISKVSSKEDKAADRATAAGILLQSIGLAAIITLVVFLLPIS